MTARAGEDVRAHRGTERQERGRAARRVARRTRRRGRRRSRGVSGHTGIHRSLHGLAYRQTPSTQIEMTIRLWLPSAALILTTKCIGRIPGRYKTE